LVQYGQLVRFKKLPFEKAINIDDDSINHFQIWSGVFYTPEVLNMIVYVAFEIPGFNPDQEDQQEVDDILDCLEEKVDELGYSYWIEEITE
jgi:hypothetical protein